MVGNFHTRWAATCIFIIIKYAMVSYENYYYLLNLLLFRSFLFLLLNAFIFHYLAVGKMILVDLTFWRAIFFVNPSHYTHWYELAIYDETFYWINRPLFKYDNGSHSMQLFVFWLIFSKPISRGDLNISIWLCAHFAGCIFTYTYSPIL